MPKIEPKGTQAQAICMVCGKPFEYISDDKWIPAVCPDCPAPIVAACMLSGQEVPYHELIEVIGDDPEEVIGMEVRY